MQTTLRSNNISYTKKTITQVKATIKKEGHWQGLLVPNKVNSFHFEGGWHLGHRREFNSIEELEKLTNNMLYSTPKELGNRIAFYEIR